MENAGGKGTSLAKLVGAGIPVPDGFHITNVDVLVLRQDEGEQADLLMVTLWESKDAIRKFAGDNIDKARYYPQDSNYSAELEPAVAHYDTLINSVNDSLK